MRRKRGEEEEKTNTREREEMSEKGGRERGDGGLGQLERPAFQL